MKVKKCPFCGGSFNIVCIDEYDNMLEVEYLDDYPDELYKHDWRYGITHSAYVNPTCPIAHLNNKLVGDYEYDHKDEAIIAINRRAAE